jgi:hypothetical protein
MCNTNDANDSDFVKDVIVSLARSSNEEKNITAATGRAALFPLSEAKSGFAEPRDVCVSHEMR